MRILGHFSVDVSELLAIYEGLLLALRLGLRIVSIESDAANVIKRITNH